MVNFEPTPEQQRFIEAKLGLGQFRDAQEVVRAGLRLWMRLEENEREAYEHWHGDASRRIQEGLEALERGELVEGEEAFRRLRERLVTHGERAGTEPTG